MTCKFCQCELTDDNQITEDTCRNCGLAPEVPIEEPEIDVDIEENSTGFPMQDLMRSMRELQFVRWQQFKDGETDNVTMQRCLSEIILMMEEQLNKAKLHITKLNTNDQMKARHAVINAIVYGMGYVVTHPVL